MVVVTLIRALMLEKSGKLSVQELRSIKVTKYLGDMINWEKKRKNCPELKQTDQVKADGATGPGRFTS